MSLKLPKQYRDEIRPRIYTSGGNFWLCSNITDALDDIDALEAENARYKEALEKIYYASSDNKIAAIAFDCLKPTILQETKGTESDGE